MDGARAHTHRSGEVTVPLPLAEAFDLFTPQGEARWAEGWSPVFFARHVDTAQPGSAFAVDHGDDVSTWIVTGRTAGESIRYARWAHDTIGLVTVTCRAAGDRATIATVDYDLTSMTPEADARIDRFSRRYAEFLAEWDRSIAEMARAAP